jgi:hypothetical protein
MCRRRVCGLSKHCQRASERNFARRDEGTQKGEGRSDKAVTIALQGQDKRGRGAG